MPWTLAETFLPFLFFWIVRIVLNISVDGRRGSLRSEEETLFFFEDGTLFIQEDTRLASICFLNSVPQMIDKLTPCQVGGESRWKVMAFLLPAILPALCPAVWTDFLTWHCRTAGDGHTDCFKRCDLCVLCFTPIHQFSEAGFWHLVLPSRFPATEGREQVFATTCFSCFL